MINEEIDLTNKTANEIIDAYYNISVETRNEVEKYERVPEMVEAFVENYSLVDDEENKKNSS